MSPAAMEIVYTNANTYIEYNEFIYNVYNISADTNSGSIKSNI